jgi:hypothetical protein
MQEDGNRLFVLVPENLGENLKDQLNMPEEDQEIMQSFFEDTHLHLK